MPSEKHDEQPSDPGPVSFSPAETWIEFAGIPWESPSRGVRMKKSQRGDQCIRLIEFDECFREPDWCQKGHIGYVIEGRLEIDFGTTVIVLQAGDGLFIPAGEHAKHKARVTHGKATLFVVENIDE